MSDADIETTGKAETDHEFRGDVQRLGKRVGKLPGDLAGIAKGAEAAAHSGANAVIESGRHTIAAAKRHPAATLGIAVGVGVLIGLVGRTIIRSRRGSSSQTEEG